MLFLPQDFNLKAPYKFCKRKEFPLLRTPRPGCRAFQHRAYLSLTPHRLIKLIRCGSAHSPSERPLPQPATQTRPGSIYRHAIPSPLPLPKALLLQKRALHLVFRCTTRSAPPRPTSFVKRQVSAINESYLNVCPTCGAFHNPATPLSLSRLHSIADHLHRPQRTQGRALLPSHDVAHMVADKIYRPIRLDQHLIPRPQALRPL